MDRLVILDPPDLSIRVESGKKSVGTLQLRNVMHTMPVGVQIDCSASKKYIIRPPHAIIAPLGVVSVNIILNPQFELPDSFDPLCLDKFTVKSVVVPGGYSSRSTVSLDWFTSKKKAVYCDTALKVRLIGGGILRNLVKQGSMDSVRDALERDLTVADCTDEHGQTAMHVAVSIQRPEMVQLLLEFKVNLELRNKAGQTPLQQASSAGEALITELLLANGANTEATNGSRWTSLHHATVKGHYEVMELLVRHGADLDAIILDGRTAMHIAVAEGHKHCLKLLLEKGCNVDAQSNDGGTALHIAAARGHVAFVKLLLDRGANKEVRNCQGRTPYAVAVEAGQKLLFDLLRLGDSIRRSARRGDLRTVKKCARNGAVIDGEDQYGWTALHRAALKGRMNVVKFLVENGADVDHKDEEGYTALHTAVESGQKDVVQFLVDRGANVLEKTNRGQTPLHLATTFSYPGIARILVKAGASSCPLSCAIDTECSEFLSAIIATGRKEAQGMELVILSKQPYNIVKYLEPVSFGSPDRSSDTFAKEVSADFQATHLLVDFAKILN
ncbi:unnamed protein product [Calypogeia fissa]